MYLNALYFCNIERRKQHNFHKEVVFVIRCTRIWHYVLTIQSYSLSMPLSYPKYLNYNFMWKDFNYADYVYHHQNVKYKTKNIKTILEIKCTNQIYMRHSYLSYCWQRKKDLFCESFIESIIFKILLNVLLRGGCSIVKNLNNWKIHLKCFSQFKRQKVII